ncbi:MAG TPA: hypothetical protein VGZ29_10125 [Terriglobia bacterium]|nr:hypothetical protein [Terriglobia bacterium]
MNCCEAMGEAIDRGAMYQGPKHRIDDGRIVNEIDTEYFIRSAGGRGYDYSGINYCPFCGRALSNSLWAAEKKK